MADETVMPEGYYEHGHPNYWKLASAKRGHTQMASRIWAPGDTYHVCTTCSQQVNIASDGRHDCDAALLIQENARLDGELSAAVNQAADLTRQLAEERAARLAAEAEVARLTNVADAAEDFIDNGPPRAKAMYTDGEKWTLTCCDERQDRGHREGCLWEILESTLEVAASPATPAGWR